MSSGSWIYIIKHYNSIWLMVIAAPFPNFISFEVGDFVHSAIHEEFKGFEENL